MAIDPVVPRSRRNVLVAAAAGVVGLLAGRLAEPSQAEATTGTMVYGTSMDAGLDQTGLTSSATSATALFQNSASGNAVEGVVAGSQPAILGANTSFGIGVLGGSSSGIGVEGGSTSGNGVFGTSTSGDGVTGISASAIGVVGQSTSLTGVIGTSASTAWPGLLGQSTGHSTGVIGFSGGAPLGFPPAVPTDTGVYGYAASGTSVGVRGESPTGTGTSGLSGTGTGVQGSSTSGDGVAGTSSSFFGVIGTSSSGIAVGGSSSGIQPAIRGLSESSNTGVFGFSRASSGVLPPATPGETGVYGYAAQDATAVGVKGQSASGTGVVGQSASNVGVLAYVGSSTPPAAPIGTAVFAASAIGGHDLLAGGSGRIGLLPNLSAGPPATGSYMTGDLFCDAAGNLWVCVAGGSPGSFRKLAGPATAGALHPINPARVYDSRLLGGPLSAGTTRTLSVSTATAGSVVVPPGAIAIAFNLTIAGTVGSGWLGVVPSGAPFGTTSTINWYANGQEVANGGTVKLGGDRQIDIVSGGRVSASTQLIVDITGYYL